MLTGLRRDSLDRLGAVLSTIGGGPAGQSAIGALSAPRRAGHAGRTPQWRQAANPASLADAVPARAGAHRVTLPPPTRSHLIATDSESPDRHRLRVT